MTYNSCTEYIIMIIYTVIKYNPIIRYNPVVVRHAVTTPRPAPGEVFLRSGTRSP